MGRTEGGSPPGAREDEAMHVETIELEGVRLTRVGYMDIPVPADLLGLAPETVAAIPWAAPTWTDGDQPRVGAAAWLADVDGRRLAFDPLQALDVLLRPDRETEVASQDAVERLLADAGFPVESVDVVVLSHIDGVGMVARRGDDGGWAPFFPNARILLSDVELAGFLDAARAPEDATRDVVREAWTALVEQGRVATYADGEAIAPGLLADVSGGHGPGHAVMHFAGPDGATALSLIGHLAVTPIHLATGECAALNEAPAEAWSLLHRYAADGRLIAGSLWPAPGHGRWLDGELRAGA